MDDTTSRGSYGENIKSDRLTVTDDVSVLAEKSNVFASFLTVERKFKYSCIYMFHITFQKKSIWKLILLQTNMFNIFLVLFNNQVF